MKIKLLFVGKETADIFQEPINLYLEKIKYYNPIEVIAVPYLKNAKAMTIEEQKKREGEMLLKKIEPTDYVILLDEYGKEYTSIDFSELIQQRLNSGTKSLLFVIGGAYGFSAEMYARGEKKFSLSRLTFPHLMTRLIFTEQLYRAFTILKNEPYHHS